MASQFAKSELRALRDLRGAVYEAEARQFLSPLAERFKAWERGELPSAELIHAIHEFHQGDSRTLWRMFNTSDIVWIVARAIAGGVFPAERVPEPILAKLQPTIESVRSFADQRNSEDDDDEEPEGER